MRRTPAWIMAVVVGWSAATPSEARAVGVVVSLAAGLPGSSTPTSSSDFLFDSPHAPAIVAINQLTGGITATAGTAGGTSFFGGAGTPVLLNLGDGSAQVAGGNPPGGASPAGTATAAPSAGGTIPSDAALLGIALAEPDAGGARALTAAITDGTGNPLGTGTLSIPDGGWWVLGLTPNLTPTTTPPDTGPIVTPEPGPDLTPDPIVTPPLPTTTPPGSIGNPAATPEPSTIVLVALGGVAVRAWRRVRPAVVAV